MGNLAGFDATTVPESDFSAMPKDSYPMIATESEFKPTKSGDGEYLQFTFEVLDGQYKGRKVWARLNLKNKKQSAVDMAQRELASICKAVGVPRPNSSAELHNIPLIVYLDTERDDRDREVNVIKKYEPFGGGQSQQRQASTASKPTGGHAYTGDSARSRAADTSDSGSAPRENSAAAPDAAMPWNRK
jgi:hypothetical protein